MVRNWTFGFKIAAGFALVVAFAVGIGIVAGAGLGNVVASKDAIITRESPLLVSAWRVLETQESVGNSTRAFLLTGDGKFLTQLQAGRGRFADLLARMRAALQDEEGQRLLEAVASADADYQAAIDRVVDQRTGASDLGTISRTFEDQILPVRGALDVATTALVEHQSRLLDTQRLASTETAQQAGWVILVITVLGAVLAAGIAAYLARTLNRQIGAAVQHVQSSSAELHAAANQQAVGVKEQVTSMSEINTTIRELLAASRQIAESAQRVAQVSEETTAAATIGDGTVSRASDSISGIRRQVDLVVGHMLDLGKKSQQIGAVLDIVSELAEQTSILSINATIEAAGAGDAGKRFAVVADEIRKLAERVAESAKEIRTLIEDVRSSVNTTVMATESGSKAVESGSREFGEVTTVFARIAELVGSTADAAREIELSTKQQATAVEQVNIAIANVAQATRETEASAGQTIQTASELAVTSRDLLRLVQARRAA